MSRQYFFNPAAYQKRNLPRLILLGLFSISIDLILAWNLYVLNQTVIIDTQALAYGRIGIWFLLLLNTILFKGVGVYSYLQQKKERTQGTVTVLENCALHVDKVKRYSRLQVRLRLGTLLNKEKEYYEVEDRYKILEIAGVKKDRFGNLQITGKIEMQLINEFLESNPELDFDSSQKVIHTKHSIPAYYENMDELFLHLQSMIMNSKQ